MSGTNGKRTKAGGTASLVPPLDVIGLDGRARVVRDLLAGIQSQRYELSLVQNANKLSDDSPVPGAPPDEDGVIPTFAQKREQINAREQEFLESVEPRVLERLRELVG